MELWWLLVVVETEALLLSFLKSILCNDCKTISAMSLCFSLLCYLEMLDTDYDGVCDDAMMQWWDNIWDVCDPKWPGVSGVVSVSTTPCWLHDQLLIIGHVPGQPWSVQCSAVTRENKGCIKLTFLSSLLSLSSVSNLLTSPASSRLTFNSLSCSASRLFFSLVNFLMEPVACWSNCS